MVRRNNQIVIAPNLSRAIGRQLGTSDHFEIQQATNALIDVISRHIVKGEQIAFMKRGRNGKYRLTSISIERDED